MERQRRGFAFELAERRRRPIFARRLHEKDDRALERRWRKSAAGLRAPFGHPCLHPRRDLGFQHSAHPAPRAPRIALEQHGQNDLVARPPNVVGRILGRLHEEESPEPAGHEAHVADSILGTGLLALQQEAAAQRIAARPKAEPLLDAEGVEPSSRAIAPRALRRERRSIASPAGRPEPYECRAVVAASTCSARGDSCDAPRSSAVTLAAHCARRRAPPTAAASSVFAAT